MFCTPHEFGTRGEILFVGIAGGDHRNPDYEWFAGGFQPFQIVQNLPVVLPGQNPVAFRIGTLQILVDQICSPNHFTINRFRSEPAGFHCLMNTPQTFA